VSTAQSSDPSPIVRALPLFGVEALSLADRRASARHHIPSIVLMERAGVGAAAQIMARYPTGAVTVVCGAGNNGGDGYVVARILADAGWDVQIATPRGVRPQTPDATTMATIAHSMGLKARTLTPSMIPGERVIVDALLGIGSRGEPREPVASAIAMINQAGGPVVAMDVPSGVDADSGVVAAMTVTFHGDKIGLHIEPARVHAGEIVVQDIGIPRLVQSRAAGWLMDEHSAPVPPKGDSANKYTAGAVLVVAGSPGMTGAGTLSARATLRCGGGLTVAAVPSHVQPLFAEQVVEVMATPVPDHDGVFGIVSLDAVLAQARRVAAIAIGPGIGRDPRTTAFVRQLIDQTDLPCVIDADALWHLGARPGWLKRRAAAVVVTPHAGEAARLLDVDRTQVDAARLASARSLAKLVGGVAILKGPGAIIADAAGGVCIDAIGTSALATAGSGDVLTGIVASMLAKGMAPFAAAATAVRVHSRAGVLAGHGDGTLAGDLVEHLPEAISE
jgi:NAD(P)H-hydrate epimerase